MSETRLNHIHNSMNRGDWNSHQVTTVVVAASRAVPITEGSHILVNNWGIYLESSGPLCVRLTARPEMVDTESKLDVRLMYFPTNVPKRLNFSPKISLNAQQVVDRIIGRGFHIFQYKETMLECRHWVLTVIKDLLESGMIDDSTEDVFDVVSSTWFGEGFKYPHRPDWTEGNFSMSTDQTE